jgi:hypothetical protein
MLLADDSNHRKMTLILSGNSLQVFILFDTEWRLVAAIAAPRRFDKGKRKNDASRLGATTSDLF